MSKAAEYQCAYRRCLREQAQPPVAIPLTAGQTRAERPHKDIFTDATIRDESRRVIIWFKKGYLSADKIQTLYESTKKLERELPPEEHRTKRGVERVHHFGCWRKYTTEPALTKSYRENSEAQEWVTTNTPLFGTLAYHFWRSFRDLYDVYTAVEVPIRLGAWSTVAINFNWGIIAPHKDTHDYRNGLCWVVVFGNFTGGQIHFPELNITVHVQPGDLIAFKSYELLHQVLPYVGERYSIVMFQHHNMFFDAA